MQVMGHGLASHILVGRRVAAIRPSACDADLARVIALPGVPETESAPVPTRSPRLDAAGAVLRLDGQVRLCIGPLCGPLDWSAGMPVVIEIADDGRAVARQGRPGEQVPPEAHLTRLDGDRRLLLPTTVRAHLGVSGGDQVAAVVANAHLVLVSASVAWAAVAAGLIAEPAPVAPSEPARRSGPRPRRQARVVPQ